MLTYSDLIEHATDQLGGAADNRQQSFIRRAVVTAFRRVAYHPKGWRYYIQKARVNLNALFDEGTVAYTASTRTFSIDNNILPWPTWAASGEIRIGNNAYEIESRTDSDSLVAAARNAPTGDLPDQAYQLVQTAYPLPLNFQDIYRAEHQQGWCQKYITPQEWFSIDRSNDSAGEPRYWTVLGDSNANSYGRKALHVYPIPTSSTPLEFLMRRTARVLRYSGQETACITGTISISSGGTTVTGVGTSFSPRMVGSVLRVTDGTAIPTGIGGLEPYVDEYVISGYTSATVLTIATPASQAFTTAKFRISDPVDADECMISCILRAVEYELAVQRNTSDAAVGRAKALFSEELVRAWEADALAGIDRAGIPLFPEMPDDLDVYSVEVN